MDALLSRPDLLSRRFLLVNYMPALTGMAMLLVLLWAGLPGSAPDFTRAYRTATGYSLADLVVLALAVLVLAILGAPLQLSVIRLLEGGWPVWLGSGLARWWQLRRRASLTAQARFRPAAGTPPSKDEIQRVGSAAALLRRRFPGQDHLVRATALGNILAAMEDSAGRAYGFDAVVAWPRLYPTFGTEIRAIVDGRRDSLDAATRLTVTAGGTAVVAAALLAGSNWWLLLVLVPLAVAWTAYRGALAAATAYAEAVRAAFDLHRFDLLVALHLPLPADRAAEIVLNQALCDEWRQNAPFRPGYDHHIPGGLA